MGVLQSSAESSVDMAETFLTLLLATRLTVSRTRDLSLAVRFDMMMDMMFSAESADPRGIGPQNMIDTSERCTVVSPGTLVSTREQLQDDEPRSSSMTKTNYG